jgi:hypothetical protein
LQLISVDSSGWRNRAARGIIQMHCSGNRMVTNLGKWRGREPSRGEWRRLSGCGCPTCVRFGIKGLKLGGTEGFCNRACHNLWVLLEEAKWLQEMISGGCYRKRFRHRLDNSIYLPVIENLIEARKK